MSIDPSIEGVGKFIKENDELIADIKSRKETLEKFAEKVKANRDETDALVKKIEKIPFTVAKESDTKERQTQLLNEIKETRKKIHLLRDNPTLVGLLHGNLSRFYLELGNTYLEESVENIVTFTQDEVDEIRVLLRRATLDAQARQNLADILDAAVQIGKLGLKIALKLAA